MGAFALLLYRCSRNGRKILPIIHYFMIAIRRVRKSNREQYTVFYFFLWPYYGFEIILTVHNTGGVSWNVDSCYSYMQINSCTISTFSTYRIDINDVPTRIEEGRKSSRIVITCLCLQDLDWIAVGSNKSFAIFWSGTKSKDRSTILWMLYLKRCS